LRQRRPPLCPQRVGLIEDGGDATLLFDGWEGDIEPRNVLRIEMDPLYEQLETLARTRRRNPVAKEGCIQG
jgi:hypothetical protein